MWCLSLRFLSCRVVCAYTTLQDERPLGCLEVESPEISGHGHKKVVRLSALRIGRLYLQEISPVLLPVRGWVDSRVIVRPEELSQRRIPATPSGIEPVTFRLQPFVLKTIGVSWQKSGATSDIKMQTTLYKFEILN